MAKRERHQSLSTADDARPQEIIRFLPIDRSADANVMVIDSSPRLWRVYHETYELVADRSINDGAEWWYRGRMYAARAGLLATLEPGEVHTAKRLPGPVSVTILQIGVQAMTDAARELGMPQPPHFIGGQCAVPALHTAVLAAADSVENHASPLEQQSRLLECIRLALGHACERALRRRAPPDHRAAALAHDYLHDHAFEHVTLDELAVVSGASRFHLVHSFTQKYGLPPHQYQNAMRIASACRAIRAGASLSAVNVGFADQSHFSRHFKHFLAVTPGRYAAALRRSTLDYAR